MSRKMATLDDLRKQGGGNGDHDSDDEAPRAPGSGKGPNTYYAGSGQSIVGPGGKDKKGGKDMVDDIMKQQGVGGAGARGAVVIKFWKNGFTVDEGELRSFDAPENKEFMDAINKGVLPPELREKARAVGGDLDVSVEDHRGEEYKEPAYRAFGGSGAALGAATAAPSSAVVKGGSGKAVAVDESKPTTTIQVKLANGKREKIVLNLTNTVSDLQSKVAALGGVPAGKGFSLTAGFPPKPLADGGLTIEAAGLKSAAVNQVAQ